MLLTKVKKSLRISGIIFDDEIQDVINAALMDLKISGVINQNQEDPLIIRAVITYAKANFGLDNKDSEKHGKAYEMIKTHLALSSEYNEVLWCGIAW